MIRRIFSLLSFLGLGFLLLPCQSKAQTTFANQGSGASGSQYSCSGPTNNYSCTLLLSDGSGKSIHFTVRLTWVGYYNGKGTGMFVGPTGTAYNVKWTLSQVPVNCGDGYTLTGALLDSVGDLMGTTTQTITTFTSGRGGCGISDQGGSTTIY